MRTKLLKGVDVGGLLRGKLGAWTIAHKIVGRDSGV